VTVEIADVNGDGNPDLVLALPRASAERGPDQ